MAVAIQCLSCARFPAVAGGPSIPSQRKPLLFSLPLSRNLRSPIVAASSKKKNKKNLSQSHVTEGDEDAFELLFKQLEEDLKNDDLSKDDSGDGDEITEEDLALLERELEDAFGDFDTQLLNSDTGETEGGNDPAHDSDDEDESPLKLKTWQMKKLARALKAGRRKTGIKDLAAELCLDRALVLELLRDPPPNLLMMSLSIPNEPTPTVIPLETKPSDTVYKETSTDHAKSEPEAKVPIHAMQRSWSAQKRLKKAHIDTLERVYSRSRRPTDAMISSIVHVTKIPRRRVIKWFEEKRAEEGVPDHRVPYQRSSS